MKLLLVLIVTTLGLLIYKSRKRDAFFSIALALLMSSLAIFMIMFPEPSFKAAERGLTVWWDIVLPALLPFFIAAELLMKVGIVHFMGVLMEPLMRPLFNVPGAGSFTLAMGIASGYPLGAALAARLKDDGMASKTEAERLVCFCNTSDPLFMSGAVAVGMFNRPELTSVIVGAHYLSALTVGLALRFWRWRKDSSPPIKTDSKGNIVSRAYTTMRKAQRNQPPLGELLGESVGNSIKSLLQILGFMVIFSVIFELMSLSGMVGAISNTITAILPERLIPSSLHEGLVSGLFEITIGCTMSAKADAPLYAKVAVCSFIIAWSGLSVHAQVAAVIHPSRLSSWPYTTARAVQAFLAAIYSVILMNPSSLKWSLPTFTPYTANRAQAFLGHLGCATKTCFGILLSLAVVSGIVWMIDVTSKTIKKA
jgi:sporulation integral membrane protein YlbJ